MAQVTLYMDEDTVRRMRTAAESAGQSVSAWVVGLVRERTRTDWPAEVAALAGAWSDFPTAEELRAAAPLDVPRLDL